jgi:hypothetical protein
MNSHQDFFPTNKTLDCINVLSLVKLDVCETTEKLKDTSAKIVKLREKKNMFGRYSVNDEILVFDRNVLLQLRVLRNLVLHFQEQKKNNKKYSVESVRVYNEIVSILDFIETGYSYLNQSSLNVLMVRPGELFNVLIKTNIKCDRIFDKHVELAIEYIEQLETMLFCIINHLDEIEYDIRSYSQDFFNTFLSIDPQIPEN